WYVVAILSLASVSGWVDRGILGTLLPSIKKDFALSDTQASLLQALPFGLFFAVLGLPIARLADRSSRRNIIAGGAAVWSVFSMLSAWTWSFMSLMVMRIGVGAGEATLSAPSVSLIADYFPRDRLSRAMSIFSLGIFLGSGIGYYIGGLVFTLSSSGRLPGLGTLHPWQATFIAIGVPGLIVALLLLTVREPTRRNVDQAGRYTPLSVLVKYVADNRRTYLAHGVGFGFSALVKFARAFWIPTFFARAHGWDEGAAARTMGVLTMTIGVAGVLSGGWLGDWLARRGRTDAPILVGIVGAIGMVIAAPAFSLMPTGRSAVIALAVVNFFAAFPWGAASAAAAEMAPTALRAQSAAVYFFVLTIFSGTIGPLVVGLFNDHVFGPAGVAKSLAVVTAGGTALAAIFLAAGLGSYRRTLIYREGWIE